MGLFQRRDSFLKVVAQNARHWKVAGLVLALSVVIACFGDTAREALKYDRLAILNGEYWRLVSAHFTHLGPTHLLLNLAGLVLVWLLVGRYYSNRQWLFVLSVSIAAVSGGFWFFDPNMLWYVGLSGVLHGLLLAGAVRGLAILPSESAILCVIVIGKLVYEQVAGPLPGSESVSGGTVIVNAHLFGGVGGIVAAAVLWHRGRRDAPI